MVFCMSSVLVICFGFLISRILISQASTATDPTTCSLLPWGGPLRFGDLGFRVGVGFRPGSWWLWVWGPGFGV